MGQRLGIIREARRATKGVDDGDEDSVESAERRGSEDGDAMASEFLSNRSREPRIPRIQSDVDRKFSRARAIRLAGIPAVDCFAIRETALILSHLIVDGPARTLN